MKKTIKLMAGLLVTAVFAVSCNNESNPTEETNTQAVSGIDNWETTNPEIIASINAEIELKRKTGKTAAVQLYRNFRLETDSQTPADVIALIKGEIDQMYSSGLKTTTLAKMDDVTSIYLASSASRGLYYSNSRVVINDYATYRSVKQSVSGVVPHELTHYYHDRFISGGFNNSAVIAAYNSAKSRRIYPSTAYVLSNNVEYLGTSAEAFFAGTSRDPYNRATVTQKDPQLTAFINANF
jgi:hypothetical protein